MRYRAFCDELRLKYKDPLPGKLSLTFYMLMPASWSKRKKASLLDMPHTQKPDIDNLCKSVMDALAEDDSYIYLLMASKWWSDKPGIEFGIMKKN